MTVDQSPIAFAAQMTGRPLAMSPDAATAAFDLFSAMDLRALASDEPGRDAKPYEMRDGVATIRVHDQLVSRASWLADLMGLTSYNRLRNAIAAAAADRDVRGVILEFDSPGGDLAGSVETAAAVRALAAQKPVVALIDSVAASAAYVVAAAANRIVVTPSASVGSIGVVYLHLDRSSALAKSGVKATLLHAGKFKVDGNRYAALGDEPRRRIQAMIGDAHDLMLNSIGLHRPALGAAGARKTEAGVFMGAKAVAAGLADAVGGLDTARAYLFPSQPFSPPPAAIAAPPPVSSTGAKPMPTAALFEKGSALAAIVAAPYQTRPEAVLRALKKDQLRAKANAIVASQLGAQSIDEQWSDAHTRIGAKAAPVASGHIPTVAAKPAGAQKPDDLWREIMEKQKPQSAFRGIYR